MPASSAQHLGVKRLSFIVVILLVLTAFPVVVLAQEPTVTPVVTRIPHTPTVTPSATATEASETSTETDIPQPPDEFSWIVRVTNFLSSVFPPEWTMNFTANLLSSGLLALWLYVLITRPNERRALRQRKLQLLGMLKSEFETNVERAKKCIELFESIEDADSKSLAEKILTRKFSDISAEEGAMLLNVLPRFTRGVWNALKEGGFMMQLEDADAELIYYMLRTNEAIVTANSTRLKLRNKLVDGAKDIDKLANKLVIDSKYLLMWLNIVLPKLEQMKLPVFRSGDIPEEDTD